MIDYQYIISFLLFAALNFGNHRGASRGKRCGQSVDANFAVWTKFRKFVPYQNNLSEYGNYNTHSFL